jgi:RNA polymerase sigma-70 factor, ECF subfamily
MTTMLLIDLTVGDLVRAAQSGDRAAFGELFARFERSVFAIVLRKVGNHAEAEELCQDVFMQAMEKIGQLREPDAFAGWLRSIAVRKSINRAMKRTADLASDEDFLANHFVDETSPLDAALGRERVAGLQVGLDRLGTMDRETLVAFYVREMSLAEMSDEFAVPLGTIKRRLHVARQRLAREVEALTV